MSTNTWVCSNHEKYTATSFVGLGDIWELVSRVFIYQLVLQYNKDTHTRRYKNNGKQNGGLNPFSTKYLEWRRQKVGRKLAGRRARKTPRHNDKPNTQLGPTYPSFSLRFGCKFRQININLPFLSPSVFPRATPGSSVCSLLFGVLSVCTGVEPHKSAHLNDDHDRGSAGGAWKGVPLFSPSCPHFWCPHRVDDVVGATYFIRNVEGTRVIYDGMCAEK